MRFYTVVVLAGDASSPKTIHIGRSTLVALVSGALMSAALLAFLVVQCGELNARVREMRKVRQDEGGQSIVATAVERLERQLGNVRELHRELRVIAGLEKAAEREADESVVIAQGGTDTESLSALRDTIEPQSGFMGWVSSELRMLADEIVSRERGLQALQTHLDRKTAVLAATPTIYPAKGFVTAGYGYRASPFTGRKEFHEGIDIAAPFGAPVRATADGVVSFAGPLGTYGNVVFIDHGHGFATAYGHNSQNRVKPRQRVRRGDVIAYIGSTGRSTGPHVHYEVHVRGVASNPSHHAIDTSGVWASDVSGQRGSS
jgi:murein DD-endopeptidase MepM/ murein hydrolase activator NlpD